MRIVWSHTVLLTLPPANATYRGGSSAPPPRAPAVVPPSGGYLPLCPPPGHLSHPLVSHGKTMDANSSSSRTVGDAMMVVSASFAGT
jgi:hypothetical protein